tara:strand:- start:10770 stop:12107 length:1338 start_codon:yes stop_codon:yes gene_type:complete
MADGPNNQKFTLSEAIISSDRFGADDEIECARLIYELTIFESLDNPYLSGMVALVDDKSIFGSINFSGTERMTIRIQPSAGNETFIDKTFIMTKMAETVRGSNDADVILFNLIEPHAYFNSLRTLSRAYTGSIETIVSQILNGELKKKVDLSYLTKETTAQGVRKFIVPYLTPLDACKMLIDRATSTNGSPTFLYATAYDNNIRMGDLDKMLQQPAFNEESPFVYSQAKSNASSATDEFTKSTTIKEYVRRDQEDTLDQIMAGGVGAFYTNTDVGTGVSFRSHVSIKNSLETLKNSGVLKKDATQVVFDESLKYLDRTADEYNSQFFHQVNSSLTYNQIKSYHDAASGADFLLKIKKHQIEQALYKNVIKFSIPGTAFFMAKATVGDICRFRILKNISQNQENPTDLFDEKGSGNFLIHSLRHTFRQTDHNVSMEVCRLTRSKVI